MNISSEKYLIEVTQSELWTMAFDVRSALEYSLKTHWVNHQDKWREGESERLSRIKTMFSQLGRFDLYDEVFIAANVIFDEHNKKK